jgi:hypothetical protein
VQRALRTEKLRVPEQIADIANMDAEGAIWKKESRLRLFQMGNRLWHTDSSFKAPSGYASMLYARSVAPIGGHTEFADMRAAWDALPEAMKTRLQGLIAEHSLMYSRRRLGFTEFTAEEKTAFAPVRGLCFAAFRSRRERSMWPPIGRHEACRMQKPRCWWPMWRRRAPVRSRTLARATCMWTTAPCTAAPNTRTRAGRATCSAPPHGPAGCAGGRGKSAPAADY